MSRLHSSSYLIIASSTEERCVRSSGRQHSASMISWSFFDELRWAGQTRNRQLFG
jgi:hypothetical protein